MNVILRNQSYFTLKTHICNKNYNDILNQIAYGIQYTVVSTGMFEVRLLELWFTVVPLIFCPLIIILSLLLTLSVLHLINKYI